MRLQDWAGVALSLGLLAPISSVFGEEVIGARAVLERIAAEAPADGTDKPASTDTLAGDVEAYAHAKADLAPAAAAEQWLALVDRWLGTMRDPEAMYRAMMASRGDKKAIDFAALVKVIPGPEAWPALRAAVDARPAGDEDAALREAGLRVFVHFLTKDADAVRTDLERMVQPIQAAEPWQRQQMAESVARILTLAGFEDSADRKRLIEVELAQAEASPEDVYHLEVPNLIAIYGDTDEAREIAKRFLLTRVEGLNTYQSGEETKQLLREVATTVADQMAKPRWELVDSPDAVELYEAMTAKTKEGPGDNDGAPPAPSAGGNPFAQLQQMVGMSRSRMRMHGSDDYKSRQAHSYYVLGLMLRGQMEKALAAIAEKGEDFTLPYNASEYIQKAGLGNEVEAVLRRALETNPAVNLWRDYQGLAIAHGRGDDAVAFTRATLDRDDLAPGTRRRITASLVRALLAADRVDEGVALQRAAPAGEGDSDEDSPSDNHHTLLKLGLLLDRPEWVDESLEAVRAASADEDSRMMSLYGGSHGSDSLAMLVRAGRYTDAERWLGNALWRHAQSQKDASNPYAHHGFSGTRGGSALLARLAGVYHELGRHEDVVALLDEAPYWEGPDLAAYLDQQATETKQLAPVAAAALAHLGRKDEAIAIVHAHLLGQGAGHDASYAMLIELLGQDAAPRLDALAARNRFEERPLIWKATLQLRAGDADAALATIREAIAIDPSDGEQGKGDRLRAYAVLADVLDAKGQADEAAQYREAVAAIRLSEDADDFYAAGLLSRAIKMYQQALDRFVDAYCVQWRIAVHLAELGRHDEAAAHFRKAYELMPSSFGRVESHCFGCEGVFRVAGSEDIGREVLTRFATEQPDKPQVHYLLGYYYESVGEPKKALPYFERAVELDPDYLNAWRNIEEVADDAGASVELRDKAALNMFRLQPLAATSTAAVWDIGAMWELVATTAVDVEAAPTTVYPLRASAEEIQRRQGEDAMSRMHFEMSREWPSFGRRQRGERLTPGEMLAGHSVTSLVSTLLAWNPNE